MTDMKPNEDKAATIEVTPDFSRDFYSIVSELTKDGHALVVTTSRGCEADTIRFRILDLPTDICDCCISHYFDILEWTAEDYVRERAVDA